MNCPYAVKASWTGAIGMMNVAKPNHRSGLPNPVARALASNKKKRRFDALGDSLLFERIDSSPTYLLDVRQIMLQTANSPAPGKDFSSLSA